jgi:hypothetical protein
MTDRLAALREHIRALAALAAEANRRDADVLAEQLLGELDATFGQSGEEVQDRDGRPARFRSDQIDRFRINLKVESCPRCTLRSFRPQEPGGNEPDVLYVCSSCGYQARLELTS